MLAYPVNEMRWGIVEKQNEQQVAIWIAVIIRNSLIVEALTDIINHLYIQALNV